ncbi:dihydrofolate reductase, partial [Sporormia fimetaria CBS 119925]
LILAATPKLGIGHLGQLPWPSLKTEMGYFARVTKRVPSLSSPTSSSSEAQSSQRKRINAVIMGRKTWDSIPEKFRPLKGRLNVVVTRDGENASGLALHGGSTSREPEIARIFVIGGASLYEAALGLRDTERVLLTKIHTEYECDTFFP